jgi:hypothetical protein
VAEYLADASAWPALRALGPKVRPLSGGVNGLMSGVDLQTGADPWPDVWRRSLRQPRAMPGARHSSRAVTR